VKPGSDRVEVRRGERVIGQHHRVPRGEISFDPAHGKAIEALTLASLHRAGRRAHRRKPTRRLNRRIRTSSAVSARTRARYATTRLGARANTADPARSLSEAISSLTDAGSY
jgi:hypothetical protein